MAPFGAINDICFKGTTKLKIDTGRPPAQEGKKPIASAQEQMPEVDVSHGRIEAADILAMRRMKAMHHRAPGDD